MTNYKENSAGCSFVRDLFTTINDREIINYRPRSGEGNIFTHVSLFTGEGVSV